MFKMLIKSLEVIRIVNRSMRLMRRSIGFQLWYRSTGPHDRSTGFSIICQPESMHFGFGRILLARSIGVRDRSTGPPQI